MLWLGAVAVPVMQPYRVVVLVLQVPAVNGTLSCGVGGLQTCGRLHHHPLNLRSQREKVELGNHTPTITQNNNNMYYLAGQRI